MTKLNIEMSMASLVVRLARGQPDNDMSEEVYHSSRGGHDRSGTAGNTNRHTTGPKDHFQSFQLSSKVTRGQKRDSEESQVGINVRKDFIVMTTDKETLERDEGSGSSSLTGT